MWISPQNAADECLQDKIQNYVSFCGHKLTNYHTHVTQIQYIIIVWQQVVYLHEHTENRKCGLVIGQRSMPPPASNDTGISIVSRIKMTQQWDLDLWPINWCARYHVFCSTRMSIWWYYHHGRLHQCYYTHVHATTIRCWYMHYWACVSGRGDTSPLLIDHLDVAAYTAATDEKLVMTAKYGNQRYAVSSHWNTCRRLCVSINGTGDLDLWPWNYYASCIEGGA